MRAEAGAVAAAVHRTSSPSVHHPEPHVNLHHTLHGLTDASCTPFLLCYRLLVHANCWRAVLDIIFCRLLAQAHTPIACLPDLWAQQAHLQLAG